MVDDGTWNRLDDNAKREFCKLLPEFQESLRRNGVHDGADLAVDWSVAFCDGCWVITNGIKTLDGFASQRREVMHALYTDGVQNLNR